MFRSIFDTFGRQDLEHRTILKSLWKLAGDWTVEPLAVYEELLSFGRSRAKSTTGLVHRNVTSHLTPLAADPIANPTYPDAQQGDPIQPLIRKLQLVRDSLWCGIVSRTLQGSDSLRIATKRRQERDTSAQCWRRRACWSR